MRERLDLALVGRGLVATRARARDLVRRGLVRVNGLVVTKTALAVSEGDTLAVPEEAAARVSRGGAKLGAALEAFGLDPARRVALDVGASAGGFVEVLLERGATHVYAVDVGHGQLHPRLAADPRVTSLEGTDGRTLTHDTIAAPIAAIVADVSFVSLTLVLPPVMALAAPGAWLVALIKPQFEVGRAAIGKGGVVRDDGARRDAVVRVAETIAAQPGWHVIGTVDSPLAGGSGNREVLIGARHDG
jgi:23S rRNA (cytidine1920-2'-O)/16S rRNA (cytidine1409-2'-O)-methyltransferase